MAKPNIPEFWNLLGQSGLVQPDRLAQLQNSFAQMRGVSSSNAPVLAEWLISENAITRYQSDVLLKGLAGPFNYGDFQVVERIRSGRLKRNYRAKHLPTQHTVLLHFFSGEIVQNPAEWSAAVRAASTQYDARSPYLTCCHEIVDLDQYKFAALENLAGRSLAESIQAGVQMPVAQACAIVRHAALGAGALHVTGQPHGDIRPENIWLADDGRSILIAFPLTRPSYCQRAPLDETSIEYAAPELHQIQPNPTPASDIYALGCLLYQLIAGKLPFASPADAPEGVPRKMARHAGEPIVPLQQISAAPEALNQVVSYMMAKNVSVRYQATVTVAEALAAFAEPSSLNLQPPEPATRAAYEADARSRRSSGTTGGSSKLPPRPGVPTTPSPTAPTFSGAAATGAGAAAAHHLTRPAGAPTTTFGSNFNSGGGVAAAGIGGGVGPIGAVSSAAPATSAAGSSVATPSVEELLRVGEKSSVAAPVGSPPGTNGPAMATKRRVNRSNKHTLLAVGIALALLLLLGGAYLMYGPGGEGNPAVARNGEGGANGDADTADGSANGASDGDGTSTAGDASLTTDDGGTTDAAASVAAASENPAGGLDIRYIPPNPQMLFSIRSAEFFATPAGRQCLASMRDSGADFEQWIRGEAGFALNEIERLDIALYEKPLRPAVTLAVWLPQRQTNEQLLDRWQNPESASHEGRPYWRSGSRGYYIPNDGSAAFAVANVEQIPEILDMLDQSALDWMSEPMRELGHSVGGEENELSDDGRLLWAAPADPNRQVTVLFASNYLRSARTALYPGRLAPLHDAVSWFLGAGEDVQAGLLSLDAGDSFFAELRLYCAREVKPEVVARDVYNRLGAIPDNLVDHLSSLQVSSYSTPLMFRLRNILQSVHRYTRYDRAMPKSQQAVLRCYLPAGAASYLVHAADLVLLETAGTASGAPQVVAAQPKTVWDKLKKNSNLAFGREPLIKAVELLEEEIGVKIEIQGKDLELDGITKNQSFGIEMRDKPAEEILLSIVQRANPEKADGPADEKQKLIYVVKENPGGEDVIWITTRAAATKRGDKIPDVFQGS